MNIGNIVYSRNTSTATKLACDKYHSIKRDDFCLFRFFPVGRSKKFFDWLTNRCVVLLPPLFLSLMSFLYVDGYVCHNVRHNENFDIYVVSFDCCVTLQSLYVLRILLCFA